MKNFSTFLGRTFRIVQYKYFFSMGNTEIRCLSRKRVFSHKRRAIVSELMFDHTALGNCGTLVLALMTNLSLREIL